MTSRLPDSPRAGATAWPLTLSCIVISTPILTTHPQTLDLFRPEIIDLTRLSEMTNRERLQNAFTVAQKKFGIEQLLDPEDVDVEKPDERSIITYVSSLYDVFPKVSFRPFYDCICKSCFRSKRYAINSTYYLTVTLSNYT